ncbi:unnamed protein product [marine sediment metagenome]|uniref:Uncharacterized protein n=1 Tax=marine sediment metagenome TaxID=412755 RepID=X1VU94_9ZZZZ
MYLVHIIPPNKIKVFGSEEHIFIKCPPFIDGHFQYEELQWEGTNDELSALAEAIGECV